MNKMNNNTYTTEKQVFYGVSAPAGSGKTTKAIKYAGEQASNGGLFIFAVPSLLKTQEVYDSLKAKQNEINKKRQYDFSESFNLEVITSDTHKGQVQKTLSSTMERLHKVKIETGKGGIIIVTHEGFLLGDELVKREKPFHLIWDETTTIIFHIEGNILKEMKAFLFDNILDIEEKNGIYTGEVKENKIVILKERLQKQGIGFSDSKGVQKITKHLLNAGQGFCDILLGGNIENQVSMVFIYNHLKFYGYQSTIFLGANLELTNLYRWFLKKGIVWKKHPNFSSLNVNKHQFRLDIYYGNKGNEHTRNFLDKTNEENKTYRELFREKAIEILGDQETIVMKNNSDEYDYPNNYKICTWNMEGLNEYNKFENGMYIGTFNQHPTYYSLIDKLELEDLTASLHLYQFLMRLACRNQDYCPDKNNRGIIKLTIPCLKLFEPIEHLFNEKLISYIPMDLEFEEYQDKRKSNIKPVNGWYLVSIKEMKSNNFPRKKTINDYVKWFKTFGYKSKTLDEKYKDKNRHTKIRKQVVVYKSDKDLEDAKNFLT